RMQRESSRPFDQCNSPRADPVESSRRNLRLPRRISRAHGEGKGRTRKRCPQRLRGCCHQSLMLKRIDRLILRVPQLQSAVNYYRDVLGLKVVRHDANIASLHLGDGETELVLHTDDDLPADAVYYLVDDVRDLYRRRDELRL